MVQIRAGWQSITGNFRENNEDRCLADPENRYFLVADGMGGQVAGERASELAIELISEHLERSVDFTSDVPEKVIKSIDKAVSNANIEIMAAGELDPNCHNMGTTVVFLLFVSETVIVGGVGDSRVYRLQGDDLEQLTTDHSLTQALIDAGTISEEEAEVHRYRNVLYRYLGTKDGSAGTEALQLTHKRGERFMLCSDGVTDGADEAMLMSILKDYDDPQRAAEAIVVAAQEGGSKDNITSVVVHVD